MAAGIGSRFGGAKQLARVGPDGEAFLDYAIADAANAGATRVVIIVRTDIEDDIARHVARRHGDLTVTYVRQDELGPARAKPWGTAHAVLAAVPVIEGPFMVVNADDYYGETSYGLLASATSRLGDDEAVLVAFELGRTLPGVGTVSRGVCAVDGDRLTELVETHEIGGTGEAITVAGVPVGLTAATPVSMNMWGFPAAFCAELRPRFDRFLAEHGGDETAEFLLPSLVAELMAEGRLTVAVERTSEDWVGVTNPADLEVAQALLASKRA